MAKKAAVVKKVAKPKAELFNAEEIEAAGGGKVTKASVFRDYLSKNPDATFGKAKADLIAAMKEHGLELKDSDAVPFGMAKKKLSGDGSSAHGKHESGHKEVSLKQFAALIQNIDPAVLADAIRVIGSVGGVDNARRLAAKWADLCEAIGEPNARKAIEVL